MARPKKPSSVLNTLGAFEHDPQRKRASEPIAEGSAVKPKYLKGLPAKIWDEYAPILEKMGTLFAVDAPGFATWCCLEAEFQKEQSRMTSARITQKRAYEERFGMSSGARAKMGVTDGEKAKKDPAEKYFDDSDRSGAGVLQ
jgi:hypothetical protein